MSAMNPQILKFIFDKLDIDFPIDIIEVVLEAGKNMMADKGYKNLAELASDADFQQTVLELGKSFIDSKPQEVVETKDSIYVDAVVRCPHCELPFMIEQALPDRD